MQINQVPLSEVNQFSSLFLDYIQQSPTLAEFSGNYPDIQGFNRQIDSKKLDINKRKVLVETLKKQYANLPNQPDFDMLLSENTFTVTTGHQLNIFTGPLYVVYKMITAINLAKKLRNYFPDYNFVPVYWMASEDHDFAEINHFSLFGKMHTWEDEPKRNGRDDCKSATMSTAFQRCLSEQRNLSRCRAMLHS
jgi:bacillithiol synthase